MLYRGSMRIVNHRLLAGCATALVAAFALAGCVSAPTPTPSTSAATDAPVFASDEEALAAATEAYAAYQAMSDLILAEGGANPDRIRDVASESFAASEIESFNQAMSSGLHSTGLSTFDKVSIQAIANSSVDNIGVVTVYLCSDVSRIDILNSTGVSVVSESRPDRTPFEVTFDIQSTESRGLVVGSRSVWTGGRVC